ncbi:MAG: RDD family protein, partial [Actinomycetota bacterium]
MDPADLDDVLLDPNATSQGADLSPRMSFVPPPELPTPECASIEARAKAQGIDALVWLAALILLGIIFGGISSSNGLFRIKVSGPPFLMATVLWLAYMTLMEAKYGGSIGKRARGLRVVMEDGEPVNPEAALIRNLMRFLDAFPYVAPYVVGAIAASNSPLIQRYGDRVAETMVVVSVPASPDPGAAGFPPHLPP